MLDAKTLERFRVGLARKRSQLAHWLETAPVREREERRGPAPERAVEAQLHTLDTALDQLAAGTFGECTVCHEAMDLGLLEMDYTATVCLAHFTTDEVRQLESELQLAQVVQRALLPQQAPAIPCVDLAAFSLPAQIVGGDYFDFLQFRGGAYGLAIADVAGHGMSAGLLMASVQTALRALVPSSDSPADVVREAHRLFNRNVNFTTFVTMFLGALDPATHTLTYCNAGHNPPLLVRGPAASPDGTTWLRPTGAAIGVVDEGQYGTALAPLLPGDVLLLYTDGVTEAFSPEGEAFGEERLAAAVRQAALGSARDVVRGVRAALAGFTRDAALGDDTTAVAVKVTGG